MWIASNTRDATIPPTKNRMPHRSGPIRSSRRGPRRIRNARLKRRWNRFAWRNIIVTYARGPEWYGPTRYTAKSSQNRSSPEPGSAVCEDPQGERRERGDRQGERERGL